MTLEQHAASWVDMAPHVATLTRLATGAQTILELGTRGGVSTWALLDGLPTDGQMVSVDIADVSGLLPERVTTDPRWQLVVGDDLVVPLQRADLVFIDTSHEYHHTLAELRLVAGASRIALHDWMLVDVQDAAERFMRESGYRLYLLEPSQWGLAVLAQ